MCYRPVDIVYTPTLTRDHLYRLRPSGHRHCRLNSAAWRAACEAGVALQRPTHRGCRGGARKQRPIRVIVSSRPTAPAKPVPRVRHLTSICSKQYTCGIPLTVCCLNAQSVRNKATSLADLVISRDIDILALTETWLGVNTDNYVIKELVPSGYTFLHTPRYKFDAPLSPALNRGGGVGLMYKSGMKVESVRSSFNFTHFEHADYYITTRDAKFKFRLGVIYRPPRSKRNGFTKNIFFEQWSTYLDTVMLDPHDIVITGDVNFHLDIVADPDARRFSEMLSDRDMRQLVTHATHNKGHLLDVVIVRNNTAMIPSRPSVYDPCLCDTHGNISGDHMAIMFCVNAAKPARMRKEVVFRRLHHICLQEFKRDIVSLHDEINCAASVGT